MQLRTKAPEYWGSSNAKIETSTLIPKTSTTPIIVPASSVEAELDPAPINRDWILEGTPQAWFKFLGKSEDAASWHVVWECTEGRFDWHYDADETAFILSGEVFISSAAMKECRVGPGDMMFFPAGSTYRWRVTKRIRKFAVLRRPIPPPLRILARAWNRFMRSRAKANASAAIGVALSAGWTCLGYGLEQLTELAI